jgi:hypothetical protein
VCQYTSTREIFGFATGDVVGLLSLMLI